MKKFSFLIVIATSFLFSSNVKATPPDTSFVSVQVGGSSKTTYLNILDKVTDSLMATAILSNITIENSNPDYASILPSTSNPRRLVITPIAGGTGTAIVSCHVTYTDPGDGLQKSEDKTIVIAYTVIYNPPHGVKLSLVFN